MFKGEQRFKINFDKDDEFRKIMKDYRELVITKKLSNDIKKYIDKWEDKNYFYLNLNEYIKYKNKYLDYMYKPTKIGFELMTFIITVVFINYLFVVLSRNFDYKKILLVIFAAIFGYVLCLNRDFKKKTGYPPPTSIKI